MGGYEKNIRMNNK